MPKLEIVKGINFLRYSISARKCWTLSIDNLSYPEKSDDFYSRAMFYQQLAEKNKTGGITQKISQELYQRVFERILI